jgi:hypothetical protein
MSYDPDGIQNDPVLTRAVAALRTPVDGGRDLPERVLAEVREPAAADFVRWLVRPRPVFVRPIAGIATAVGLIGLVALARLPQAPEAGPPSPPVLVRFALEAPAASRVALVGDFNDWDADATPLRPVLDRSGFWAVEVPLPPGRHEYGFVVDGNEWSADPLGTAGADDFGAPNSVIHIARSS